MPARSNSSKDDIPTTEDIRREERLEQFRQAARRMGKSIEALGLTDEELEAKFEAARKEYHDQQCHDKTSA